jgi:hypothetical protein
MQPYFLPYIGYFHLMAVTDVFVIYDRIKHTKKGWINRNRFLLNGVPSTFSLPLRNAPDDSLICERELAAEYDPSRLLRRWEAAYRGAPYVSAKTWDDRLAAIDAFLAELASSVAFLRQHS